MEENTLRGVSIDSLKVCEVFHRKVVPVTTFLRVRFSVIPLVVGFICMISVNKS